jgi:hypothetical protein
MSDPNARQKCPHGSDMPPLCRLIIEGIREADMARHDAVLVRLDGLSQSIGEVKTKLENGLSAEILRHTGEIDQTAKETSRAFTRIERLEKAALWVLVFIAVTFAGKITNDYIRSPRVPPAPAETVK